MKKSLPAWGESRQRREKNNMKKLTERQKIEKRLKELDDENEDFQKAMPEWSREMRFGN
uniref:Uncharacterized protein n=1 Tax=viral metagenome TaxID=1070528 RepID=A0A6M3Y8M7_9ZZZZ